MKARCLGWWEQHGYGRQAMEALWVDFEDQNVQGGGCDIVGEFALDGVLQSDSSIVLRKQYLGKHTVHYRGFYDGEGTFFGAWDIDGLSGNWSIKLLPADEFQDIAVLEGKGS